MIKDLKGQRFGKLVVIEMTDKRQGYSVIWKCLCDCGNYAEVSARNLQNKEGTRSCGCLYERQPEENLIGKTFGRLKVVRLSKERSPAGSFVWGCMCECGNYTEVTTSNLKNGNTQSCGCLNIEHINKWNEVFKETNFVEKTSLWGLTKKPAYKNNSGVTGVRWDKRNNKWQAYIGFQYKFINLGRFRNKNEAIEARQKAEEKYFKPILEKYGV